MADVIQLAPTTTIEVLTPDFLRKPGALEIVVAARPDVFNHNLETVPRNYLKVCPGARYFHSIRLLQRVKELDPTMFTKSGIMVGLGEERNEVLALMDDLRSADVDFLTIGQYLAPSRKHHPVVRYVTPDEFKSYSTIASTKGFHLVSSTPLTRSSHHAGDDFALTARVNVVNRPDGLEGPYTTFTSFVPGVRWFVRDRFRLAFEYSFPNQGQSSIGAIQADLAF